MHPYISIFGRNFSSYSIMALIGVIAAVIYIFIISLKKNMSYRQNVIFMLYGIPFAYLGAVLLYYLTQIEPLSVALPYLFSDFEFFISYVSFGFVFYGGLIGFLCGLAFYANVTDNDCRTNFRYMVPAIPLFHAFGRIGCYLAGCCYGKDGIPVQLIESGFNFVLFAALCIIAVKCNKAFTTIGIYFISYGIFRFIIEFFRGDEIRGIIFGLSTSQWISLLLILPLGIYNLAAREEKNHFNKWFNGKYES